MSIESRLLRGDNPEDVAKLFLLSPEDIKEYLVELGIKEKKPKPDKKAK